MRGLIRLLIGLVLVVLVAFGFWYGNEVYWQLPIDSFVLALLGSFGMVCVVLYFSFKTKRKYRTNKEHGSAEWGNPKNAKNYSDTNPKNNIILTQTESLTMNPRPKSVKYARNKNVLVIGGSGSGKTRFYAKPNLMQCESPGYPTSFVVTDPKGTLAMECGDMLKKNGYDVKILNTIDFDKSFKYNPFAYIKTEKDILSFVNALISNTKGEGEKSGEDFWVKAERLLFMALISAIFELFDPEYRTMGTLVQLIDQMEVREEQETFKNAVDLIFEELEKGDEEKGIAGRPDLFCVRQYKKYKLAAGKTAKSILISCATRLAPFDIKEVRDLMGADELELDKLGGYKEKEWLIDKNGNEVERVVKVAKTVKNKKTRKMETKLVDKEVYEKTALFVIIDDTDTTFNFIVALMYSQLFKMLCTKADNEFNGRLPVHVRFILDEFANIGKIPRFEKLIATIRSREVSVTVILQTESQLKAEYEKDMDTIIGNCDTQLFLGGKEKGTLESISKMLGKETIDSYNTSKSGGKDKGGSTSYQKMGRELMTMDEIATMDGMKCILQIRGERPFLSRKYDLTKHHNYKMLSDADEKLALDLKKHIADTREMKQKQKNDTTLTDIPEEMLKQMERGAANCVVLSREAFGIGTEKYQREVRRFQKTKKIS